MTERMKLLSGIACGKCINKIISNKVGGALWTYKLLSEEVCPLCGEKHKMIEFEVWG